MRRSTILKLLFGWALVCIPFAYGFAAGKFNVPPGRFLSGIIFNAADLKWTLQGQPPRGFVRSREARTVIKHRPAEIAPGLTLIAGVGPAKHLGVWLVDTDGRPVHRWDLDWFRVWPDAKHLAPGVIPRKRPGGDIHGLWLSPNGDLTFNYDRLGMVQVDICDRVKWRLPVIAHHDMAVDDQGNFWVNGLTVHDNAKPGLVNYKGPIVEDEVFEVSPDGRLLRRISLFDLFLQNGLQGLLYMGSTDNRSTTMSGEVLHSNAIDVFHADMASGAFEPGDILVSLRNINTLVVFNPDTHEIKRVISGRFIRQHDAEFIDGWTVSAFDNNNLDLPQEKASSRIVEYSVQTRLSRIVFEGTRKTPFYTQLMGKQQRLPGGGLLLSETSMGRALEVNARGELVWEYFNQFGPGVLGVIDEAERISPARLSLEKLNTLKAACPTKAAPPATT